MHFSSKCSSKLENFNLYKSDFHQSHFDKNHWPGNSLVAQWLECCAFSAWPGFDSWLGNAWRKKWQPTPVFLPGKSHRWRRPAAYSPWGFKELDTTEQLGFLSLSQVVLVVKKLPANVQSLGGEGPLEECMAIYSTILAWRICKALF